MSVAEIKRIKMILKACNYDSVQYVQDGDNFHTRYFLQKSKLVSGGFNWIFPKTFSDNRAVCQNVNAYFFIGDNLGASMDSRYFGPVMEDQILSLVIFNLKIGKRTFP